MADDEETPDKLVELTFDRPMLKHFKTAIDVALAMQVDDFEFEGHAFDVRYAVYLFQYLDESLAK